MFKKSQKLPQIFRLVIVLFALTIYSTGKTQNNDPSENLLYQNKSAPIYIKLEIEDFAGIGEEFAESGWRQSMSWHPQWSRGGASGWWGARGLANASQGIIAKEIFVPQDGEYALWMRYQDYFGKAEPFSVSVEYINGVSKSEFGLSDKKMPPDSKTKWSYVWNKKIVNLKKGRATVKIQLQKTAEIARDVDALVLTTDLKWIPRSRGFPPQAYSEYLLKWAEKRQPLEPLIPNERVSAATPQNWKLPDIAGRDFWYFGGKEMVAGFPHPVNILPEIDNPNTAKAFVERFGSKSENAPIFSNPLTAIQIPITQIKSLLEPDNSLREYILKNKRPFVVVGNYNSAGKITDSYQQLNRIFGNLWVGIISGENTYLEIAFHPRKISDEQNFKDLNYQWLFNEGKIDLQRKIETDWASKILNPFEKIILAHSVGSIPHVHQLAEAGSQTLAAESAAAMPYVQAQAAFVRGAARQYEKPWIWYFGASFGSAIRTFTKEHPYIIDLEGEKIDSRNALIGPSLAHIRRTLLFAYLQGASSFYPEQGYNLLDTQGQLNPMGWSYEEMLRLAQKHPNRGVIYTPVAILLDKAHGWDKYGYKGMRIWDKKPLTRSDQMINQFFNVAYFPFPKNEGEAANDLNIPFPNGYFGDMFDVLVTSPTKMNAVENYPVVFCVGDTRLNSNWVRQLKKYVNNGGTLVINAEQIVPQLDEEFLGVKLAKDFSEDSGVVCGRDGETLSGTPFRYQKATPTTARIIARTANGDPIAFVNKFGKGRVILTTPSYLMGYDEAAMPYLAHLLLEITGNLKPIDVRGNAQYFINLRPDGYVLTLSNNEGLVKLSDSPAEIDKTKVSEVILRMKEKPLLTEDWISQQNVSWSFPNEWLPEYTTPKPINWLKDGDAFKTSVKLLPGEIRIYFIKTRNAPAK